MLCWIGFQKPFISLALRLDFICVLSVKILLVSLCAQMKYYKQNNKQMNFTNKRMHDSEQ